MFRSGNRPARRYLYFRYVINYLWAKQQGNQEWVEQIDNKGVFWASPGPYLEKSTLISLGRNISGFELPPSILESTTFDGPVPTKGDENQDLSVCIALREANMATSKAQEDEDGHEDEDEDEDEEQVA